MGWFKWWIRTALCAALEWLCFVLCWQTWVWAQVFPTCQVRVDRFCHSCCVAVLLLILPPPALRQLPSAVGGHRWTSTRDLPSPVGSANRDPPSSAGAAGPQPPDSSRMPKYFSDRMPTYDAGKICQNLCQIECQTICTGENMSLIIMFLWIGVLEVKTGGL